MGSNAVQPHHLVILPMTWNSLKGAFLKDDVYVLKEQGYSDARGSVHIVFSLQSP